MSEIVLVPAWRRPEFLWAALTRIWAARDHDDIAVRVVIDRNFYPDVEWAANRFNERVAGGAIDVVIRDKHRYHGNSYNVLESYREATLEGHELVHLVEEDILVGYDYFDLHRRAHELVPDAFCVSACRNQQFDLRHNPPQDEGAVYKHMSYQSIGVSFRSDFLASLLADVGSEYYSNMVAYCQKMFPASRILAGHAEQDGLLHRKQEALGRPTVYAAVPRAYHAGFVGYHRRGVMMAGSIEERAKAILSMSAQEMNERATSYKDHTPIDLDADRASVSHVIQWP